MIEPLQRSTLLAVYQLSVLIGIVLMPVAVLARRGGVTLPVHRVLERVDRAYRKAREA